MSITYLTSYHTCACSPNVCITPGVRVYYKGSTRLRDRHGRKVRVLFEAGMNKQTRKGFRTKARDGDFIEYKLTLMEFYYFDQNSHQKTEFLPIGKVDKFES